MLAGRRQRQQQAQRGARQSKFALQRDGMVHCDTENADPLTVVVQPMTDARRAKLLEWKARKQAEQARARNKAGRPPFIVPTRRVALGDVNGPRRVPQAEAGAADSDDEEAPMAQVHPPTPQPPPVEQVGSVDGSDLEDAEAAAGLPADLSPSPRRNLEQVFQDEQKTSFLSELIAGMNFDDILAPAPAPAPPAPPAPSIMESAVMVIVSNEPATAAREPDAMAVETDEPVKDGAYFRTQLLGERECLQGLCDEWVAHAATNPEVGVCIGQAQLLMAQRMQQFDELCGMYDGQRVTSDDLTGFWEMVMIQIDEIKTRFNRLTPTAPGAEDEAQACMAPRKKRIKLQPAAKAPANTSKNTPRRMAARRRLQEYKKQAQGQAAAAATEPPARALSSLATCVETAAAPASAGRPMPKFKPRMSLDGVPEDRPLLTPVRASRKDREELGTGQKEQK